MILVKLKLICYITILTFKDKIMKKSLFISILALLFSAAALVKVFYPCQKAGEEKAAGSEAAVAVSVADIEAALNEKPEIVVNALNKYQMQMQEQAVAAASQLVKDHLEEVNNDPNSPSIGNDDAEIVLVEFYDYACGFCHRLFPELNEVMANNKDVKFVFKPMAFVAPYSDLAARAALAADKQGKFVEMHNALFTVEGPLDEAKVKELAEKIGLDADKLLADAESEEVKAIMAANDNLAGNIQVGGVPTLILNGELLQTIDGDTIQSRIDELKN